MGRGVLRKKDSERDREKESIVHLQSNKAIYVDKNRETSEESAGEDSWVYCV